MRSLVAYFCRKPLVVNVILFFVIFTAALLWTKIGKEELPEFSMNFLRSNIAYPGASAQDVELFVTKPVEENLKGVSGLYEVTATSSYGMASFRITVDPNIRGFAFREKVQDLKDAIERTELPRETEDPLYSQFNSAEKAIVDLGLYLEGHKTLDVESRQKLQAYALAFKNKLLSMPEISGVESSGYLKPEIHIHVNPEKLKSNQLSMASVGQSIISQHIRVPAGNMTDRRESEVSLQGELDTVERIDQAIVQSGFEGQRIAVEDIAETKEGFERTSSIRKINGHEAVIFNIQKSSSSDILAAQEVVDQFTKEYLQDHKESGLQIIAMDDESYDVRNRLSIIGSNGLIGFVLIVLVLFLFLDFSTGFWVAMGIPFSLAFTLIGAMLFGFTINNMTLASIIIVLGIVVDDAIIIAENISRRIQGKEPTINLATDSTMQVLKPVIASILTTCAAFLPLYFFSGRFGLFVKYIPTIIFLMLFASLIESAFILPTHMIHPIGFLRKKGISQKIANMRKALVSKLENLYLRFIQGALSIRKTVILLFIILLGCTGYVAKEKMKYVMFPREEGHEVFIEALAEEGITRYEMEKIVQPLEQIFLDDRPIVNSVRTRIGESRRGGEVRENEASVRVELLPLSERGIPLKTLITKWEKEASQIETLKEVKFLRGWWGSDSGSPIEVEVQENNDELRSQTVEKLANRLREHPAISNVEIERPVTKREYRLMLDKDRAARLQVDFNELASTVRSYVEGQILYTLITGDEEVDVRLTSQNENKQDIDKILTLLTSNQDQYLVPIGDLVNVEQVEKPANIQRVNFKRSTEVYADLKEGTQTTPLEIASYLENEVFTDLNDGNPTTSFAFQGEIEDSRESKGDFSIAIVLVLLLIYILLVFLYNSLSTPLLIGAIIPFGAVGVVWAFLAHGMVQYGFFSVIGALGMIGVVVNDAIVMINKLEDEIDIFTTDSPLEKVAGICMTRLRPIILTTLTTIAGIFPTAYGIAGYDSMLAEMMLAMGWGLLFGTMITLVLVPCLYLTFLHIRLKAKGSKA